MEGQQKLRHARVLVIGAGGLGSPVLSYLAAAGVGTLGIVDFDTVDLTNLQRQIIYSTSDVGKPKVQAAVERDPEHEPGREGAGARDPARPRRMRWRSSRATTSWWTARTTSRPATWSTTPA